MYDDFDKSISNVLQNIASISPSKNIGESSINMSMERDKKNLLIRKIDVKRVIAVSICILIVASGGIISFSESIRSTLSNTIKSVFVVQKNENSYEIAQADASAHMDWMNLGGFTEEEFDKDDLKNKLGFNPFIPKEIGDYSKAFTSVGINITGLSSDLTALDKDEVLQSIKDEDKFRNLKKFNALRFLCASYASDGQLSSNPKFLISMAKGKKNNEKTIEKISEFSYKGVKCTYIDDIRPNSPMTKEGKWIYDDNTKAPDGIIKIKHIIFKIDDIHYSVSYLANTYNDASNIKDLISEEFDYTAVKGFVEDYIDAYISK